MKSIQKGFTLIELMIVVAIIAILAAIAIPQYETYITKTQFTESSTIASGMETDTNLYWTQKGSCPQVGKTPGFPKAAGSYKGKYVASAEIKDGTASANATCDIVVSFSTTAGSVSKPLLSKTATFKGTQTGGNFNWQCSSTAAPKYLPEACRGN